ncbi:uncharacterized protein LOC113511089 [Galleria mellonella]|uniref:Uncharacterized protein LOC113511089 n=1 Tax=Galleria mellonella TaxID=7137 RepID=A0A6J1WBX2_GALME|nr:uncharacterized protein LOC113511089 [Galleria mellonella]
METARNTLIDVARSRLQEQRRQTAIMEQMLNTLNSIAESINSSTPSFNCTTTTLTPALTSFTTAVSTEKSYREICRHRRAPSRDGKDLGRELASLSSSLTTNE